MEILFSTFEFVYKRGKSFELNHFHYRWEEQRNYIRKKLGKLLTLVKIRRKKSSDKNSTEKSLDIAVFEVQIAIAFRHLKCSF